MMQSQMLRDLQGHMDLKKRVFLTCLRASGDATHPSGQFSSPGRARRKGPWCKFEDLRRVGKKTCFLNAMSVKERHCHFDRNPCLKLSEGLFPLHWPNQMQGKHAYLHVYTYIYHVCYYYGQRSKFDPNLNNHIPIKYLNSFSR